MLIFAGLIDLVDIHLRSVCKFFQSYSLRIHLSHAMDSGYLQPSGYSSSSSSKALTGRAIDVTTLAGLKSAVSCVGIKLPS